MAGQLLVAQPRGSGARLSGGLRFRRKTARLDAGRGRGVGRRTRRPKARPRRDCGSRVDRGPGCAAGAGRFSGYRFAPVLQVAAGLGRLVAVVRGVSWRLCAGTCRLESNRARPVGASCVRRSIARFVDRGSHGLCGKGGDIRCANCCLPPSWRPQPS